VRIIDEVDWILAIRRLFGTGRCWHLDCNRGTVGDCN
jgi:hypothetical protein